MSSHRHLAIHRIQEGLISRAAGERLRNIIIAATDKSPVIEIDFSNIMIASTSFFDEGFAKLTGQGWTMNDLSSRIRLINLQAKDKVMLEKMCRNRGMA